MFKSGYILSPRADAFWFLGLPFLAVAAALACQEWLTVVAMASVNLWITIPHHFATWVRAYGLAEDRKRWQIRLTIGPIAILGLAMLGLKYAPITLLIVGILWDKQHSLMQQHGFSRIYDFKAKTGGPRTPTYDLYLHWILFGNLFVTSPFFTPVWLRELYRLHLPVSVAGVQLVHQVSWTITVAYLVFYIGHLAQSARQGYPLNPVKYAFIAASYFMWYFTAWHVASVLVFTIGSRIMHGLQYIVIAYYFTRRRAESDDQQQSVAGWLVRSRNLKAFLAMSLFYAVIYQLIIRAPLGEFGFGLIDFTSRYESIPQLGIPGMTSEGAYDLFAAAVVESASFVHFYFDSFIWKVRDVRTQRGL